MRIFPKRLGFPIKIYCDFYIHMCAECPIVILLVLHVSALHILHIEGTVRNSCACLSTVFTYVRM